MMLILGGRRILPLLPIAALAISLIPTFARAALAPSARIRPGLGATRYGTELKVRVRVLEAVSRVRVHGYDLVLAGPTGHEALSRRADRTSEWEIHCEQGRIRASRVDGKGGIGNARELELPEPLVIRSPAGFLHVQDKSYRETVRIFSEGSLCEAVNEIDLEKYLAGLVNAEFNSRWNVEAVGAQVVAARTYALYKMREARATSVQHFDLDSTQRDQVYDGSVHEDTRATLAVERTRGLVLTSDGRVPLKAFYHSSCGGRTELPEKVWGNAFAGFRHTVPCPYCAGAPGFNWETSFSSPEIARTLLKNARREGSPRGWPRDWERVLLAGHLVDLHTEQRDPSGRIDTVATAWSWGVGSVRLDLPGAKFRDWIGASRLKSAKFSIRRPVSLAVGNWEVAGRGNGHGVGMCQWGAKGMGDRGFTTASILRHYYPDSLLRKLW